MTIQGKEDPLQGNWVLSYCSTKVGQETVNGSAEENNFEQLLKQKTHGEQKAE